jgi:hypothetical protein
LNNCAAALEVILNLFNCGRNAPSEKTLSKNCTHDSENHACFGEDGIMRRRRAAILIVKGRRKPKFTFIRSSMEMSQQIAYFASWHSK